MSITLNSYANGDKDYVAKLNQDNNTLAAAINGLLTALSTLGGTASLGPFLAAIFGPVTAFIGSTSYTQSTSGTTLTLSSGYAWRPDLGAVLGKLTSTALDFSAQTSATYYIVIGADGTPGIATSPINAMYSVVWTGSAFGTISTVAPIVPNGDVSGNLQTLTIDPGAVTLAKMADLAANSIIGNNTGSPATPIALTPSQVVTMLGAEVTANKGVASGYASLDGSGKVPSSELPASVTSSMSYQGTWDASTNTPTLTSSSGTKGYFYKVSVAGTTAIDGISQWNVGDSIVFDGTTWDKIDGIANEVVTVAGLNGAITAAALTAALNAFTSTLQGMVPASGGGTSTFLRADGTWATPGAGGSGGGSVTSVATGTGLTGGPITGSGTIALDAIADGDVLANTSGSTAAPVPTTVSALIDHALGNARGDILYRGASGWGVLAPGTSGNFLQTNGASADPAWAAITSLPSIADGDLLANTSGSSATPVATTLSALIDHVLGNTRGSILYRGASGWAALGPGGSGKVLQANGSGADPSWETLSGGGGGTGGLFSGLFHAPPTLSSFTQRNISSPAAAADSTSGPIITDTYGSGPRIRALTIAAPSTPYTIDMCFAVDVPWANFVGFGPCWCDGTKYECGLIGSNSGQMYRIGKFNSATSFNSAINLDWNGAIASIIWVRVKDDGTTVYHYTSADAVNWNLKYSVARASGFLGSSGYTNVGFFLDVEGSDSNASGLASSITLLSWYQH